MKPFSLDPATGRDDSHNGRPVLDSSSEPGDATGRKDEGVAPKQLLPVTLEPLQGEDGSINPLQDVVNRAADLARHLERYQRALASITTCPPEDTQRRLSALFALAEPVDLPREEVLRVSGLSSTGLQSMADLGLVRYEGANVGLTRLGESFLALLYMFSKEISGGTSAGYLDLIQAVTSGGYDSSFTARLLIGSAKRDARRMHEDTGNENPLVLAQKKAERDLASDRVHKAVDLIERGLPSDIQAGLRQAATDLHHAAVHQRQVAARLTRENVCLPQGRRYSDLELALQGHSWTSFIDMLGLHPRLFSALPRWPPKCNLGDELIHAFASQDAEVRIYETPRPVEGPPPTPEAIRLMIEDLAHANRNQSWHEIARSGRSYMCGVWFANAGKIPPELRGEGVEFEWHDTPRVTKPPFLDAPTIRVKWST